MFLVVVGDGDDDFVEQFSGAIDDIEVAVGHGIEAAGVNRAAGSWAGTWNVQPPRAKSSGKWCGHSFGPRDAGR